ncbi:MAG: UDP-N-acetylmuramate dehydrogenase [Aquificae bacterium]|nr:UDP-N-acetylmuramate dehydrogenase [Aquificota bacterium]
MEVERDVPLRAFTTIRVGGQAKFLTKPGSPKELKEAIEMSRALDVPVLVLGGGSNTILGDIGGLVILTRYMSGMSVKEEGDTFTVDALCGTPLRELVKLSLSENLAGVYKLSGFPASVGGALAMNAGAFGTEISEFVEEVELITWEGERVALKKEEIDFRYRGSPFPKLGVLVRARFKFRREKGSVRERYETLRRRRSLSQPLGARTSGSTFKNPKGDFAGRLLELAGFRGFRLGRVGFSEKHANFLVNYGDACFGEVLELVSLAKERVREELGVSLEEEVKLVEDSGFDGWKLLGA